MLSDHAALVEALSPALNGKWTLNKSKSDRESHPSRPR